MATGSRNIRTCVIGAGIVGTAIAHALQKSGRSVILVDRETPGRGASFGNMASIAVTEFMPASRPSVWRQMPGWLLDPEGPVRVRPSYMPRLAGWFWRFLMASRASALKRIEGAGAALSRRALADTQSLLREIGAEDQITDTGCLSLYADEAQFRADRDHIEILERFGFDHDVVGHSALHDLEPELAPHFAKAVRFPDNRSIRDPYRLVTLLSEKFEALGGEIRLAAVSGFERSDRITGVHLGDGRSIPTDEVILCAGAYSGRLAKLLDEPIPLETERGYHTHISEPGLSLAHSIIWPARAFMIAPTAGGVRVGGTVEMAGLEAAPDWRRARITLKHACVALPNLRVERATEWMGHRPALPDTVPILSASAKTRGVFYATGHGHLGLTFAATTAHLMRQLVVGERPDIDLHPYRAERFRGAGL